MNCVHHLVRLLSVSLVPGPAESGEGLDEERQGGRQGEQRPVLLPEGQGGLQVGALRHQGRQAQQGLHQERGSGWNNIT